MAEEEVGRCETALSIDAMFETEARA